MASPLRTHPWHAVSIVLLSIYAGTAAFSVGIFVLIHPDFHSSIPLGILLLIFAAVAFPIASVVAFFLRKPTQAVLLAALGALMISVSLYAIRALDGAFLFSIAPLWAAIAAWAAEHAEESDVRRFALIALKLTPLVWMAASWVGYARAVQP